MTEFVIYKRWRLRTNGRLRSFSDKGDSVYSSQPAKLTTRDSIVYTSTGLKIFGVIHRPINTAETPQPGVVMYHGFVAAKFQPPHRIFVELADRLAQLGIVSLRIDLPERGDSEGATRC